MENPNLFYQESKSVNPQGLVISYLVGIVLMALLGYLYTILAILIPFIYIQFFITLGFGIAIGISCRYLARLTHNRNKKNQIIQAIVFGLLATCFQWVAYILYAFSGEMPSILAYFSNLFWVIRPDNFFTAMLEINALGMWSLFGITFSGFLLTIVWLIETGIIVAIPALSVYNKEVLPYSETLGKWYPRFILEKDFTPILGMSQIGEELQKDAFEAIQSLDDGSATRYSKIHLFYLEKEAKQYLSIEKVFIEEQGKGSKNNSIVVNNFAIDTATAKAILGNFKNKKTRFQL